MQESDGCREKTHNLRVRPSTPSPRGGIVRTPRRPPGWQAPGPRPPDAPARDELWPAEGEDLCWLAGDWRILQRLDGHRWSADDLVTAWYAARGAAPEHAVDLGCGIGTVLLFTAWRFPQARCLGVEAQEVSYGLARRSLAWNGVEDRCEVRLGDFRELQGGPFDLVTGTPPYFPPGSGLESDRVQRAPCRFEHRGGVEDYALAAARLLSPTGRFVACEAASQSARVQAAADAAGLVITRFADVIPREGKRALFCVFEMQRSGARKDDAPLVIRGSDTKWTPEFRALRAEMGLPPGADTFE
jgi:tRNA1Val (adenine37-N6)-methyltransferase